MTQPALSVSDTWLDCADGIRLQGRLWTPAGRGPWPVLLMRQPYGRAIASTVTYAHPHWYASQGYAVLVQDVRGRGDSGGQFGGFRQEAPDTAATLAWLRSQSWCSGRIGSYGFSYQGLTQLLNGDPEQLPDALAPAMAGLDERLHWASEGGCHWWALGLGWGLQLAAQGCQRRGDTAGWWAIRHSLESGRFLSDGLALLEQHDADGMAHHWFQSDPSSSAGWRVHQPPAALWRRPMLLIGGWHDPHLRGVLNLWRQARAGSEGSEGIEGSDSLLLRIGAWSHLHWQGGLDALQLAFFDRHLRDLETDSSRLPPEPAWLQDLGHRQWRPRAPESSSGQHWGLRSNGLAAVDSREGALLDPGSGGGSVVLVHDPWRPLPGRGGHLGLDAGSVERSDLDQRCDVACFSSSASREPLELLGEPVLELELSADQPGFDLCAALSVLAPDGSVRQISTGVRRSLGEHCRHRHRQQLRLQPLLLTLQPGEALRLSLGMAAWPQIAVNPGDGSLPLGPSGPSHRVITLELHLASASLRIQPMVGAN